MWINASFAVPLSHLLHHCRHTKDITRHWRKKKYCPEENCIKTGFCKVLSLCLQENWFHWVIFWFYGAILLENQVPFLNINHKPLASLDSWSCPSLLLRAMCWWRCSVQTLRNSALPSAASRQSCLRMKMPKLALSMCAGQNSANHWAHIAQTEVSLSEILVSFKPLWTSHSKHTTHAEWLFSSLHKFKRTLLP